MRRYVVARIAQAVLVLWAAYTLSFLILYYVPSDPIAVLAGAAIDAGQVDPARIEELRRQYGYDQPVLVQYLDHLGRALRGDFGRSIATGHQVSSMIVTALPWTLQLAGAALLLAVVFGGGLAILATFTRSRWLQNALLALPPLGVAVPSFWIGLMLLQVFSFRLAIFPAFGNTGLPGLILPAVTLALPTGAMFAQVLAASLLTTLDEPYILTARAKGAGRVRVHFRHAVRNAVLPALTVAGMLTGGLVAGAVVVESVFSRNGLGRITASAVTVQDLPVVQGVVVLCTLAFVVTNLLVDLLYPVLDRRIGLASGLREGTA